MEAFLLTIDNNHDPDFTTHKQDFQTKLENLLSNFRGVDVLYTATVKTSSGSKTDDRSITDISLLRKETDKTPFINLVQTHHESDQKEQSHGKETQAP